MGNIEGLHHVTAMAGPTQRNVDFYAGILGLRLVKQTVNFDAPEVYHLYYGDQLGAPGTIMTFFPFRNMRPGRHGKGQTATTAFSIPEKALDYWLQRFEKYSVPHKHPQQRFDEAFVYFEDPDGLGLELVTSGSDTRPGFSYGPIPLEHAIRGFYSVELWEQSYERTEAMLTQHLGYQFVKEEGVRRRYQVTGQPQQFVDIIWDAGHPWASGGTGTVHHIAFATPTENSQLNIRENLLSAGWEPTPVLDRNYFKSIYFREPGGVLFEVATDPPGFTADEAPDQLGKELKLPDWYEPHRASIEKGLDKIILQPDLYV